MSQSLSAVHLHLVFSTKLRRAFLQNKDMREELHAWMGAISRELECPAVIVGGVADHVHVLARLGGTISQADWVKELKRVSSVWVKEQHAGSGFDDFQWQNEYAVFSVSQSKVEEVRDYIAHQEEHHRKADFQEELRALLRKHEIAWDERYVWD